MLNYSIATLISGNLRGMIYANEDMRMLSSPSTGILRTKNVTSSQMACQVAMSAMIDHVLYRYGLGKKYECWFKLGFLKPFKNVLYKTSFQ